MMPWHKKMLIGAIIFFVVCVLASVAIVARAADSVLTWNANTESDLAGYKFYRSNQGCTAQGPLAPLMVGTPLAQAQVGPVTTFTDANLPPFDGTMCWEITAFDTSGNESGRSNRVSKVLNTLPPLAPSGLGAVIQ